MFNMYMSMKASNLNAEKHSGTCTLIQDNEGVLYCPYATQNLIHVIWFSVSLLAEVSHDEVN